MAVVRFAVAVVIAASLLAASAPAIHDAAAHRAEVAATRQADRFADAVTDLVYDSDPVAPEVPGARRRIDVRLPDGPGPGVAYLAIGGLPGEAVPADGPGSDVVAYRVDGRPARVERRVDVDVRIAGRDDDTPLVLRDGTRLSLRLVRVRGRAVVTVAPREFKPGNGTRPRHARPAIRDRVRRAGLHV